MEVKFYFVRHGKTLFNQMGRMQGWCDSPLLQEGINQAKNVASALRDVPFTKAYSSSSQRAWDTAKLICRYHDIPLILTKGLKEYSFGQLDGAYKDEVINSPFMDDWSALGGETNESFAQRVKNTMQDIIRESHDQDTILLVGHGAYAVRILSILFGMDLDEYVLRRQREGRMLMPNTGIITFHYKDGEYYLDHEPVDVNEYRREFHPKTLDVYFMRHGQTVFNVQERIQGRCDSPLTQKGIEDAIEAAKNFKDIPLSTIYISTSERARDTADIFRQYHPGNIVYTDKICEVNYGRHEGLRFDEVEDTFQRYYSTHYGDVGGEEYADVAERIHEIFYEVYDSHQDGDTVMFVSHGDFYLVILEELFHDKKADIFTRAQQMGVNPVPNCGVAHFQMSSDGYKLIHEMQIVEK